MPEALQVQIGRIDERLKSLERKQDEHHSTVIAEINAIITEIKDLRNGVMARLERVEALKLKAQDFIDFKKDEFVPLMNDVEILKKYRWLLAGAIGIIAFLAPFIWAFIEKHL